MQIASDFNTVRHGAAYCSATRHGVQSTHTAGMALDDAVATVGTEHCTHGRSLVGCTCLMKEHAHIVDIALRFLARRTARATARMHGSIHQHTAPPAHRRSTMRVCAPCANLPYVIAHGTGWPHALQCCLVLGCAAHLARAEARGGFLASAPSFGLSSLAFSCDRGCRVGQ